MSRSYTDPTLKILWGNSAGTCAFPNCRQGCIVPNANGDDFVIIGEMAHIFAYSDGGPRANPRQLNKGRNKHDNLMVLCRNHHKIVDDKANANVYTADVLYEWKLTHEAWVAEQTHNSMPDVTFAELDIVTKAILDVPVEPDLNFLVTAPVEKMLKNNLTQATLDLMYLGYGKAPEVEKFAMNMAITSPLFAERLKSGFLSEYHQLRQQGLSGDSLFEALHQFSYGNHVGFRERAAGLAILVYLFQKCEVFEP